MKKVKKFTMASRSEIRFPAEEMAERPGEVESQTKPFEGAVLVRTGPQGGKYWRGTVKPEASGVPMARVMDTAKNSQPSGSATARPGQVAGPLATPRHETGQSLTQSPAQAWTELGSGDHLNQVFLVQLEDGNRGVYRPASGEQDVGRLSVPHGQAHLRCVALAHAAEYFGVERFVPAAYLRDDLGDMGPGSIQEYIPGYVDADDAGKIGQDPFDGDDMIRLTAFLYVMGFLDLHRKGWGFDAQGQVKVADSDFILPQGSENPYFVREMPFEKASQEQWLVPDVSAWESMGEAAAKMFTDIGLDNRAVEGFRKRLKDVIAAGRAGTEISELPCIWSPKLTVRQGIHERGGY